MVGFTPWILLRLCALIPRTSSEPVAGVGLCNVMDTEEGKAEAGGSGRGRTFMWFITQCDEQGGNGFRKALISPPRRQSLGFLTESGIFSNTDRMVRGCSEA